MVLKHLRRKTESNTRKEIVDNDDEIEALRKRVDDMDKKLQKVVKITGIGDE